MQQMSVSATFINNQKKCKEIYEHILGSLELSDRALYPQFKDIIIPEVIEQEIVNSPVRNSVDNFSSL